MAAKCTSTSIASGPSRRRKPALPVLPTTGREGGVATALEIDIAHDRDAVGQRRSSARSGFSIRSPALEVPIQATPMPSTGGAVLGGGEAGIDAQLVGTAARELVVERQDTAGRGRAATPAPPPEHGPHRVQAVLERGDHADVGAAAAHRPEEVGMLGGAGRAQLPVGGDDVDGHHVVARQPVLAVEPADAAAKGQARDAGGRDVAGRRGEAERPGTRGRARPASGRARRGPPVAAHPPGRPSSGTGRSSGHRRTPTCPRRCGRRPSRTRSSPCARAKSTHATTSAAAAQRTISAGRWSIIALKMCRAAS